MGIQTQKFRIRPVSHCKEGCSIEPAEMIGGRKLKSPRRNAGAFFMGDTTQRFQIHPGFKRFLLSPPP